MSGHHRRRGRGDDLLRRDHDGAPRRDGDFDRTRPLSLPPIASALWGNSIGVSYTATGASAGSWASAHLSGGADPADNTDVIAYYLTARPGGASGSAQITITSDTTGENGAATTVTSGSSL